MAKQFTTQEIEDAAWATKKQKDIRRDLTILARKSGRVFDDPIEIANETILSKVHLEERERYIRGLEIQTAMRH